NATTTHIFMRSVVPQPGRAQSGGERTGAPGISLPEARHLPSKSCPSTLSWRFALAISASASCQAGVPRGRRCSLRPAQVSPPNRWDTDLRSKPLPASPVILRSDMKLDEVIRILLSSNAICVKEVNTEDGREDVFYVQASVACISLVDLLEAPRHLPLGCLLDDGKEECELYSVAPEPYKEKNVESELSGRLPWLVGLLFFLTVSSAILEYFDGLLQQHLIIAFYLTALVGCGGNAGSQAASLVLQALATGELVPSLSDLASVVLKELQVSLGIALVLAGGVALRIVLFGGTPIDAAAIALAMAITVTFSVIFGASAPLILQRLGADPAKVSGPLLSTVIDIAGVLVACLSALAFQALGLW
ncbi:unnamed protein product, partial [Durusdinium trenchii]